MLRDGSGWDLFKVTERTVAKEVNSHRDVLYGPQGHRGAMKALNEEPQLACATMSLQIPILH